MMSEVSHLQTLINPVLDLGIEGDMEIQRAQRHTTFSKLDLNTGYVPVDYTHLTVLSHVNTTAKKTQKTLTSVSVRLEHVIWTGVIYRCNQN